MARSNNQFWLEVVNIFRDFSQGLYANRIPLDHPDVLEIFKLWSEISESCDNDDPLHMHTAEIGGAHPQVTAVFCNNDYMEVYRKIREIAPNLILRPLWRGINGFLLKPSNPKDLRHLLTNLAEDVAEAALTEKQKEELLRVKIFDSQGIMSQVQSTVDILTDLRKKGHPVTAEIAIPYSSGPTFPDAIYVQKVLEAARILQKSGLPLGLCRISLKDMVGELNADTVNRLFPKIIAALNHEGLRIPLGLHLHDTGYAIDAYVDAVMTCKANDYPLTIDTVECDQLDPDYQGENAWRNTGFSSFLAINEKLKAKGIDIGCKPLQIEKLKKIAKLSEQVAKQHEVRRAEGNLAGEEWRMFHVPGGGMTSFEIAVASLGDKREGLAKLLDLSEEDALRVAGFALMSVGRLTGEPHPVTPGFQNKQIAALSLLKNMLKEKMLSPIMSLEKIKEVILKDFSDEEVENLFLKGLDPDVKEFLKGEMPAETLADLAQQYRKDGMSEVKITELLGDLKSKVHPIIRKHLPRRSPSQLSEIPAKLPAAEKIAQELLAEGRIKATPRQARAILKNIVRNADVVELLLKTLQEKGILYERPDGSREPWQEKAKSIIANFLGSEKAADIVKSLEAKTLQTYTTWALELGTPNKLRDTVEKYWYREPDPMDKKNYHHLMRKFQAGRNPKLDEMERLYNAGLKENRLSIEIMAQYRDLLQQKEAAELRLNVLEYLTRDASTLSIEQIVENLYDKQKEIIRVKKRTGEDFRHPEDRRLHMVAVYLKEITQHQFDDEINKKWKELENMSVCTVSPGAIETICIDLSKLPIRVEEGQILFVMDVMKMKVPITAPSTGYIEKVLVGKNDLVDEGRVLATYVPDVKKDQHALQQPCGINKLLPVKALDVLNQDVATLTAQVLAKKLAMHDVILNSNPALTNANDLMSHLKKCGYHGAPLTLNDFIKQGHEDEIHIIDNRAGCAAKLYADLKQAGCQVIVLYTKSDKDTSIIENALAGETLEVQSYTYHQGILNVLEQQAIANEGKTIYLHPGWGLLSEDADFVKKVEALGEKYSVKFVGPPGQPMEEAGGKLALRNLIQEIAPNFNPKYFGNELYKSIALQAFIESNFDTTSSVFHTTYAEFEKIKTMGGDVMIKAIAGGGGKGIKNFKINTNLSDEENYQTYVKILQANIEYSEAQFGNGGMLSEQCIRGATRHLEIQFASTKAGAQIVGVRDCSAQDNSQKVHEDSVTLNDYPPELMDRILKASKDVINKLSDKGYEGLGTLEMLVDPENDKVAFLEVNARLQVEHMVTEWVLNEATQRKISLPLLNYLCIKYPDKTPGELMDMAFGINSNQIAQSIVNPSNDRISHLRLNSKKTDMIHGISIPSFLYKYMWPSSEVIDNIATQTNTDIIQGGIGDPPKFDSQAGAICGLRENVLKAAEMFMDWVETARTYFASNGTLSLPFVLAIDPLMYDDKLKFSSDFNTKTIDEFLLAIKKGDIELEFDLADPTITPKLKEGAMRKAFDEFLYPQVLKNKFIFFK